MSKTFGRIRLGLALLTGGLAGSCAHHPHHHKPAPEPVMTTPESAPNQTPEVAPATQPATPATPAASEPAVPETKPATPSLTQPSEPRPEPAPATQPASEPATGPVPAPTSAPTPATAPSTAAAAELSTEPTTRPTTTPATGPAASGKSLFNGKDLTGWTATDFAGHGEPRVEDGQFILPQGETLTGVSFTAATPHVNYDVDLDAQRVMGSDFFCGLTVPVQDSHVSLIVGGWGGGVCGISSIDGNDAARNDTTTVHRFQKGKWYHIRLRVLADRLQAWIDEDQIVDTSTKGHQISVRAEVEPSRPFGICSYQTTAAIKNVVIKSLSQKEVADSESDK